jgi:PhnB protein
MNLGPHLHFRGNCREAFDFYAKLMRGKVVFCMTFGESPAAGEVPAALRDQVIHARLDFGDRQLFGCDAPPERYQTPQGFNLMALVKEPAEADRLFNALSDNGSVTMPIATTFWSPRFGMCTDRFGIPWMVNCEPAPQ